jgi:hypothetical protein
MPVAALVLGILGTLCSLFGFTFIGAIVGILFSLVALVLGILGRKQAQAQARPTGMATAGLVLGIVGTAIGALFLAACASCYKGMNDLGKRIEEENKKEQQAQAAEARAPGVPLGQPITFANDSTWTVTAARDRGAKLDGPAGAATTSGRFVEVSFTITNLTKQSDSLLDLPSLVDAQGRQYKPFERSAQFLPPDGRSLAQAPLPPSLAKQFVEIYELPADAKGLKFRVRARGDAAGRPRAVTTFS